MDSILIAIVTCHRLRQRADAQRSTWVPLVHGADVRFFLGRGGSRKRADEVLLDVPDDYKSLPYKVRAMLQWALDHGYDYVMKTDDDVYIQPDRLLRSDFRRHDYVGPLSKGINAAPYACGFAHWVSRAAMNVLVDAQIDDWAEDRWTGNVLNKSGIVCHFDDRYRIINSLNEQNVVNGTEGPLPKRNGIIAAGEFEPEMMQRVHDEWMQSPTAAALNWSE